MSGEAHAPGQCVQKVVVIHAGEDIDTIVRPVAIGVETYCKIPSQADYIRTFDNGNNIGEEILKQMQKVWNCKELSNKDQIYALILVSEKFLNVVSKDADVKKQIEDLLLQDHEGKTYALVWMDVTDMKALSPKFEKQPRRGINAVNYRHYQTEFTTLAESVYKIWFGYDVYIDLPNEALSSKEATISESGKEAVESIDPSTIIIQSDPPVVNPSSQSGPSTPTIGAEGGANMFDQQDRLSSTTENQVVNTNSGVTQETKDVGGHNNPVIGADGGANLFAKEDQRSVDDENVAKEDAIIAKKNDNVDKDENVASVPPTGAAKDNVNPEQLNGEPSSLPVQSMGCQNIQTAQQDSTPAAKSTNDDSNKDTANDSVPGFIGNKIPNLNDSRFKQPVEEDSLGIKPQHKCNNPDCDSQEVHVLPEKKFYDSSSNSKIPLVKDFNVDLKEDLKCILDPLMPCVKDWRHLASRKKVPNTKITYWEKKVASGTIAYLNYLKTKCSDYTVVEFKRDVRDIERMDVIDLLEEYEY